VQTRFSYYIPTADIHLLIPYSSANPPHGALEIPIITIISNNLVMFYVELVYHEFSESRNQFHQHFMISFCAILFCQKVTVIREKHFLTKNAGNKDTIKKKLCCNHAMVWRRFRLTKRQDCFRVIFDHFWIERHFLRPRSGAVVKIGTSQKPNYMQILLSQIRETLCVIVNIYVIHWGCDLYVHVILLNTHDNPI